MTRTFCLYDCTWNVLGMSGMTYLIHNAIHTVFQNYNLAICFLVVSVGFQLKRLWNHEMIMLFMNKYQKCFMRYSIMYAFWITYMKPQLPKTENDMHFVTDLHTTHYYIPTPYRSKNHTKNAMNIPPIQNIVLVAYVFQFYVSGSYKCIGYVTQINASQSYLRISKNYAIRFYSPWLSSNMRLEATSD